MPGDKNNRKATTVEDPKSTPPNREQNMTAPEPVNQTTTTASQPCGKQICVKPCGHPACGVCAVSENIYKLHGENRKIIKAMLTMASMGDSPEARLHKLTCLLTILPQLRKPPHRKEVDQLDPETANFQKITDFVVQSIISCIIAIAIENAPDYEGDEDFRVSPARQSAEAEAIEEVGLERHDGMDSEEDDAGFASRCLANEEFQDALNNIRRQRMRHAAAIAYSVVHRIFTDIGSISPIADCVVGATCLTAMECAALLNDKHSIVGVNVERQTQKCLRVFETAMTLIADYDHPDEIRNPKGLQKLFELAPDTSAFLDRPEADIDQILERVVGAAIHGRILQGFDYVDNFKAALEEELKIQRAARCNQCGKELVRTHLTNRYRSHIDTCRSCGNLAHGPRGRGGSGYTCTNCYEFSCRACTLTQTHGTRVIHHFNALRKSINPQLCDDEIAFHITKDAPPHRARFTARMMSNQPVAWRKGVRHYTVNENGVELRVKLAENSKYPEDFVMDDESDSNVFRRNFYTGKVVLISRCEKCHQSHCKARPNGKTACQRETNLALCLFCQFPYKPSPEDTKGVEHDCNKAIKIFETNQSEYNDLYNLGKEKIRADANMKRVTSVDVKDTYFTKVYNSDRAIIDVTNSLKPYKAAQARAISEVFKQQRERPLIYLKVAGQEEVLACLRGGHPAWGSHINSRGHIDGHLRNSKPFHTEGVVDPDFQSIDGNVMYECDDMNTLIDAGVLIKNKHTKEMICKVQRCPKCAMPTCHGNEDPTQCLYHGHDICIFCKEPHTGHETDHHCYQNRRDDDPMENDNDDENSNQRPDDDQATHKRKHSTTEVDDDDPAQRPRKRQQR